MIDTPDTAAVTAGGAQRFEVRLLGHFEVRSAESRVNIPTLPARFLFAYLLLKQEHPQSREKLAALFWPDAAEANARTSLRQALWRIRKAFEAEQQTDVPILTADDLFVAVNPEAEFWLDTAVLSRPVETVEELERAVSVYDGPLLPDCFDDWALIEREFYEGLFDQKMQQLLDRLLALQRWSDIVSWAERWISLGQTPEPAYRALMYANAGLGNVSQVAIVYRRCKEALWRELGVEPSKQTTDLHDRLVKGESPLTRGYELRELIDKSESGELYRGYQPLLDREVAVKVITHDHASQPDFIRRFEAEAQSVARLEHIHIRPLYDYWRDPGGAYLVLRWLDGGNLSTMLRLGPLPAEAFIRLLDQAASALAAAHQRGIVHGHLKPDNILFDEQGNAYLTDFGIALDRRAGSSVHLSRVEYRAPEQADSVPPVQQSDQYSLALILYEALTGRKLLPNRSGEYPLTGDLLSGWPPEVHQVFEQALAVVPDERFSDILAMAGALREALLAGQSETGEEVQSAAPVLEASNPYKGLRAFQEADAADFYGREELVGRILGRLKERGTGARFLALVGPSGSGKSSVIRAGLLPALRRGALPGSENWYIVTLSPGAQPLADLEADLLHIAGHAPAGFGRQLRHDEQGLLQAAQQVLPDPGGELLLFFDQFEELFSLVQDKDEIDQVLNLIAAAVTNPRSSVRVIIALRADYYDRPLMHPAFGELVRRRTEVVTPMNADEFWHAIVAPAEGAGMILESGLTTTIVSEIMERPGALPLFQYALTELFEARDGRLLTRKAYESIGGVATALARRAEVLYAELEAPPRAAARQIFLRLLNPEENSGDALRRVRLSVLASLSATKAWVETEPSEQDLRWSLDNAGIPTDTPVSYEETLIDSDAINTVLEEFGRSRLFTFDHDPTTREPTVEVAHGALLREWDRLRIWLDEAHSDLRTQRLLSGAVKEWLDAGQDPGYLLHGSKLDQLEIWSGTTVLALTRDEKALLDASIEAQQRARDAALAMQQQEEKLLRQRRRRDRILAAAGVITLLLIAAAAALFYAADRQANSVLSGQLAAQCLDSRHSQFDLALLLCLEAGRFADTYEARHALATLYAENPHDSHFLRGHQSAVTHLAFSEDSAMLASSSADGSVRLWDIAAGQPAGKLVAGFGTAGQPDAAPAANSGEILVRGFGAGYDIIAPAAGNGALVLSTAQGESYELPEFAGRAASLALSPDGKTLAAGIVDGRIFLWDIRARELSAPALQGHEGQVAQLAFSPDGSTLASGGQDNTVQIWDLASGTTRAIVDHDSPIVALAFNPDGRYLASSSANGSVRLSDLAGETITSKLLTFGSRADALAFSLFDEQLAVGFMDGTISLWDVTSGQPFVQGMIGHNGAIKDIAYSPDGRHLASGSDDRTIILRDIASTQAAHNGAVTAVSYQPDGGGLVSGSRDGSVRRWLPDLQSAAMPPFAGQSEGVNDVAFSPDGRIIASAGQNGEIALLDAASGQQIAGLDGHDSLVTSLAFSPDGALLASGSADNTVIVWDVSSGTPAGPPLEGHEDWVFSVAFAPDGSLLASGGRDNRIILWDLESGAAAETLEAHKDWVYSLAFSHDGQWLASGGADNTAVLWDLAASPVSGSPLADHAGYVFDVAFSRDDALLFTAEEGGTIRTWDVQTGQPIGRPVNAHPGAVYSLDLSPDGSRLASGGEDAALRLWRIDLETWACEAAGRNLTQSEWQTAFYGQAAPIVMLPNLSYHQTCLLWPAEK